VSQSALPLADVLLRLLAATVLGALLGLDREVREKAAGLRTHALVCVGAASFTLVAVELFRFAQGSGGGQVEAAVLLRVVQGVVIGIGFVGAGAIIKGDTGVRGMTTGANPWLVGAVGVACGGGYFPLAALATAFAIVILTLLRAVERRWLKDSDGREP
jgi:putative Mg2+ transporter-C (MgtC) family protein